MSLLHKPKSKRNIGRLNEEFIESLEDNEFFWEWKSLKKKNIDFDNFLKEEIDVDH